MVVRDVIKIRLFAYLMLEELSNVITLNWLSVGSDHFQFESIFILKHSGN